MKNKALSVAFSKLLNVEESVIIEASEKEDGDGGLVSKFLETNNVFTLDDVIKLKKNSLAEGVIKGVEELAKGDQFPSEIHNKIKGNVLDKKEKEVAKNHGITKWDNFDDLISKISAQGKGSDGEKDTQIEKLKTSLQDQEAEHKTALEKIESKYTGDFTKRDFDNAVLNLKLEGDEEMVKNQTKLYVDAFHGNFKLSYKDGVTRVLDSEGKVLTDKVGEASTVSDVFKDFALQHGAKIKVLDEGGRGDGSSGGESNSSLKGKSLGEAYAIASVIANTAKADEVHAKWLTANPK